MKKIFLLVSLIFTAYGYGESESNYQIGTGVQYHKVEKTARELALKDAHQNLVSQASDYCGEGAYAGRTIGLSTKIISTGLHFGEFEAKAEVGAEFQCHPICVLDRCKGW
jgi:hypothetical protein